MLALKITDQKNFTNKLFLGDTFDLFWLNQAEIITSNVFSIEEVGITYMPKIKVRISVTAITAKRIDSIHSILFL